MDKVVVSDWSQVSNKFSKLIPTKEYREDPRAWEEILEQNLEELSDKSLKNEILQMLSKHQEMWKVQFGELKASKHRIDVEACT